MNFTDLHKTEEPLLICNVWDASSAKIAEKSGSKAIATSSGAIATMLGYNDGEEMSFDELFYMVKRILSNTSLPLSVDMEAGYSRKPEQITNHLHQLIELGVVGVNIEDSLVTQKRNLVDADNFSSLLTEIRNKIDNKLFLNVRTDTYLLDIPNKLDETLLRIKKYEQAGADGIFIPCLTDQNHIQKIISTTTLPINVMCMPDLPDFNTLNALGVQRISMGNFIYNKTQNSLERYLKRINTNQDFKSVFE